MARDDDDLDIDATQRPRGDGGLVTDSDLPARSSAAHHAVHTGGDHEDDLLEPDLFSGEDDAHDPRSLAEPVDSSALPEARHPDAKPGPPAGSLDPGDDVDDDLHGGEEAVERDGRTRRRRGLVPGALLLGGGAWAVAMAMRCGPIAPPAGHLTASPAAKTPHDTAQAQDDSPTPAADATPNPSRRAPTPAQPELPHVDPSPEDWDKDVPPPDLVTYRVRHGGSIKNVANLFKIFHHEILALNPGIDLEKQLAPGSTVVVYRRQPDGRSQSVGIPSGGTLENGVPMLDGPGRVLKMIPWKGWGTADTVATLDRVLRQWAADESNSQPVLVGNMSARKGGRLQPHSTHQSGRDVDLGYPQKLPKGEELNWRSMTADNLDAAATWKLLRLLRATGKLEVVFIDTKIQKLLHAWASKHGGMSKASLRRWLEYPRSGPVRSAIIQHVAGHTDHLHARFECTAQETRCKSRRR